MDSQSVSVRVVVVICCIGVPVVLGCLLSGGRVEERLQGAKTPEINLREKKGWSSAAPETEMAKKPLKVIENETLPSRQSRERSIVIASDKDIRNWPKEGRKAPEYTEAVGQKLRKREEWLSGNGTVESLSPKKKEKMLQPLCLEDAARLCLYRPVAAELNLVEKRFNIIVDLRGLEIKKLSAGGQLAVHLKAQQRETFNYVLVLREEMYEELLALHKRQDIIVVNGVCSGLWRDDELLNHGLIDRHRLEGRNPLARSDNFEPAVSEPWRFSIAFSDCAIDEMNTLDLHFDPENLNNSRNWVAYVHQKARLLAALARESRKHCRSLLIPEIERQLLTLPKRSMKGALKEKDVQSFLPSEVKQLWNDEALQVLRNQYIDRKMQLAREEVKAIKSVRWMLKVTGIEGNHLNLSCPRVDLIAPDNGSVRGRTDKGELRVGGSLQMPIPAKWILADRDIPEEIKGDPELEQQHRELHILRNYSSAVITATIDDVEWSTERSRLDPLHPDSSSYLLIKLSNLQLAK